MSYKSKEEKRTTKNWSQIKAQLTRRGIRAGSPEFLTFQQRYNSTKPITPNEASTVPNACVEVCPIVAVEASVPRDVLEASDAAAKELREQIANHAQGQNHAVNGGPIDNLWGQGKATLTTKVTSEPGGIKQFELHITRARTTAELRQLSRRLTELWNYKHWKKQYGEICGILIGMSASIGNLPIVDEAVETSFGSVVPLLTSERFSQPAKSGKHSDPIADDMVLLGVYILNVVKRFTEKDITLLERLSGVRAVLRSVWEGQGLGAIGILRPNLAATLKETGLLKVETIFVPENDILKPDDFTFGDDALKIIELSVAANVRISSYNHIVAIGKGSARHRGSETLPPSEVRHIKVGAKAAP